MADWSDLIGMSLEEANIRAEKYEHTLRVNRWNNTPAIITRDYQTNRVNVDVERSDLPLDGAWKVVKVRGMG